MAVILGDQSGRAGETSVCFHSWTASVTSAGTSIRRQIDQWVGWGCRGDIQAKFAQPSHLSWHQQGQLLSEVQEWGLCVGSYRPLSQLSYCLSEEKGVMWNVNMMINIWVGGGIVYTDNSLLCILDIGKMYWKSLDIWGLVHSVNRTTSVLYFALFRCLKILVIPDDFRQYFNFE